MSDVQFNEASYARSPAAAAPFSLTAQVIKRGLAKDAASAQRVLIITAIVLLVIAAAIFLWANSRSTPPAVIAPNAPAPAL